MRILHTIASLAPEIGGPARSITGLCDALADLALLIRLISLDLGRQFAAPIVPKSSRVETVLVRRQVAFGLQQIWIPHFKKALVSAVANGDVMLMHDHGLWEPSNQIAAQVAHEHHLPLIVSVRGTLEPWSWEQKKIKKTVAWYAYQRHNLSQAVAIHATSQLEAMHIRELGFKQPIILLPNGVGSPPLPNKKITSSNVRTLLFLSRVHPKKGLLNLVKAFANLNPEKWQILIAGPDTVGHQAEVEGLVRALNLGQAVKFMGAVANDAKWKVYQEADLFVLPTFSENFGIVIAEALASGTPVITTKATPWHELETYQCGWWVEVGVEPLTAALREAMTLSNEERWQMGQNGRSLIENKYTWPSIAEQMAASYEWILHGGSPPSCII
ncbi:MAG: glycosyltransferase [Ardenticatenaceae bacterium]|nr:glycosyltransferase [Ardenticatenaceae bacterium]